jgi:hypothetical protein
MRPNKGLFLNDNLLIAIPGPFWAPVQVGDDGRPQTDRTIIADGNRLGVKLIQIDVLADPHVLADFHPSQAMHQRPEAAASRSEESYSTEKSLQRHLHDSNGNDPKEREGNPKRRRIPDALT